jgi:hypothetical protein
MEELHRWQGKGMRLPGTKAMEVLMVLKSYTVDAKNIVLIKDRE